MADESEYVDALQRRLEDLKQAIGSEKLRVRELLEAIHSKEEQMGHIVELLAVEGVRVGGEGSGAREQTSVSEMAYGVLASQREPKPIHYRDLVDLIMAEGKLIPGRDPGANLISHMSRDERFVRTGRGMYALAKWGFKPAKKGTRRRRRTTKKSRGK
jgi:hypothetical protein